MSQKTGTKQGQKRREKKSNQKRRKGNKTLRKKWKWAKKNLDKKAIKERTKDQGSDTWIASFHFLLSNASSLVIYQSFKSLFTDIMLKLLFTENKIEGTVYSMPYPMEICFRILGKIKIDYKIKIDNNSLNIYSPCEKICKRKKDTNVRNRDIHKC
jgi:hypothetical protein